MRISYEQERKQVRKEFEAGMDELFKTMFTETVLLYFMDEYATDTNVYNETVKKIYLAPIPLSAHVVLGREHGDGEVQTIEQTAKITLPSRQLDDLGVPHSTEEDFEKLQKAVFKYKDFMFLVDVVKPRTHVADTYLFYDFMCTTRNKDKTMYILPPSEEEVGAYG